jgi:aminoglycoside phosphotransferase (APT) family kinase protein
MSSAPNLTTSLAPPAGSNVPAGPQALSADFLTACLRHAGAIVHAQVLDFESRRVGEAQGFAGHLTRLSLRYDRVEQGAPARLVAKFSSPHDATREMMSAIGGYMREVRVYRELAPRIGIATPRCYFAHYDLERGTFLLLLEDMSPAALPDLEEGLSVEQAKTVLEQLAALHARWWNRIDELGWLKPSDQVLDEVRDRFRAGLAQVRHELAEHPTLLAVASMLDELLDDPVLKEASRRPPLTLTHGDMHVENVFLPTQGGGRFALIDWQSLSATRHGTMDVTRILCMGMRPALRRAHERALLRHYHWALCAHGVQDFSFRQLRRRYREEAASMALVGVIVFATVDLTGPHAQRKRALLAARIEQALRDARLGGLLRLLLYLARAKRLLRRLLGQQPRALQG